MRSFVLDEISAVDRPAQEEALATIFKREDPTVGEPEPPSFDSFEAAYGFFKRNGASGTGAMQEAARRYPDLLDAYQAEGALSSRPSFEKEARSLAVQQFELAVDGIVMRDNVSRTVAMQRARQLYPAKFEAYQQA